MLNCSEIESDKIIFSVSECDEKTRSMAVTYSNCKNDDSVEFPNTMECYYIPKTYYKGIIIEVLSVISILIELIFLIIIIIYILIR